MANVWDTLGKGLLDAGLGYWQGSLGVDAAKEAAFRAQDADARRRAAYDLEAAQIAALAPGVAAGMALRPAQVSTQFARSSIDPATGKVGYELDPRAEGLFSGYMGGARKSLDLAGDFDPKSMAAQRLAAQQELLAPLRAAEDAKLMRMLQSKGLVGLGSYEGSASGSAENPFVAALYGARAQADKKAAYDALSEGESYLDRLLKRSSGMFGAAKDVEGTGSDALRTAADWTNRFSRAGADQTAATTNLLRAAYEAQRKGAYDQLAMERILEAQNKAGATSALRKSGAIEAGKDVLGGLLKNVGGLSGLFGAAKNWFSSPVYNYDGSLVLPSQYGEFADEWSTGYGGFEDYGSALSDWGTGADFGNFDYADYF